MSSITGIFPHTVWKGGRIDVRVSPRTGVSEWIVLTHCVGKRPGYDWWGNGFLLIVLKNLVLDGSDGGVRFSYNVRHILGWTVSRSLFPCDGKRVGDVFLMTSNVVVCWFWVWILLQGQLHWIRG
jgi:hypothetical protein